MTTDIARYEHRDEVAAVTADPTGGRLVSWAQAMGAAKQLGDALSNTAFVPAVFRGKPDDAAAAIMYGDEIGFTPGQSLQNIYVISGKPSLYARAMVALVLSHGHEIWTEASSPQRVIVCGKRRGSQHVERVEWTRAKAEQAGYTSNKKYTTDPESMLYARASGDVARRIAPDALAGIAYTVEELELSESVDGATVTVSRADEPKKTAQRKAAKKAEPAPSAEEPSLDDDHDETRRRRMHALFTERGITTHEQRVAFASTAADRQLESTNDLTADERETVISFLERGPADAPANPTQPETEQP